MKSISQSLRKKIFLTALLLVLSIPHASAQIDEWDDENVDDETAPVPIDGFLAVGLVAGAFFGIYKLKKSEIA